MQPKLLFFVIEWRRFTVINRRIILDTVDQRNYVRIVHLPPNPSSAACNAWRGKAGPPPWIPVSTHENDDGRQPASLVCETGKGRYIVSGAVMPMSPRVRASAILLASTSFSRAFITGASDGSRVSTRQWS